MRKSRTSTAQDELDSIRDETRYNKNTAAATAKTASNALKIKLDHLQTFQPLTENQKLFFDAYKAGDYAIMLLGSSGVGKSFLALYKALEEVLDKSTPYQQVVIIRSAVQVRDLGFTPGSLDEKMALYEDPYIQICSTLFNRKEAYLRLKEQSMIDFTSTSFLRGVSMDSSIIIVDECQSMTWHELATIMTRVGHRSKIIFCGDLAQNDLVKSKNDVTGLKEFLHVTDLMPEFTKIQFTTDDIVRSSLVKQFIIACEKLGIR